MTKKSFPWGSCALITKIQRSHLGNRQWDIPALRELLERIIPENGAFEDYAVEHTFPTIGLRKMRLNARKLTPEKTGRALILLAIEDVTEKRA